MNNSTHTIPSIPSNPSPGDLVVVKESWKPPRRASKPVRYPWVGRDPHYGDKLGWRPTNRRAPDGRQILEVGITRYPRDPKTGKIVGWWRKIFYVLFEC